MDTRRYQQLFEGRIRDFESWATTVDELSTRHRPIAEQEAWDFVLNCDGLWIWRRVSAMLMEVPSLEHHEFDWIKTRASVFNSLGWEYRNMAYRYDRGDLANLWEVFSSVQLQLRTLDHFESIYLRGYGQTLTDNGRSSWAHDLQDHISKTERVLETQEQIALRSPTQHLHDNLILQTVVSLVVLACIYPLVLAMQQSPSSAGLASDPDFYSQIASSILALAGFFTVLLPVYRETAAKEWIGTWILTGLGSVAAVIAIPIYPTTSVSGSVFCSWLAASCQLLVLLQVSLIAGFHRRDHAKAE